MFVHNEAAEVFIQVHTQRVILWPCLSASEQRRTTTFICVYPAPTLHDSHHLCIPCPTLHDSHHLCIPCPTLHDSHHMCIPCPTLHDSHLCVPCSHTE